MKNNNTPSDGAIYAAVSERITPSCGCIFCDLKLAIYRDDHGFYHDGPEDMRIACSLATEDQGA